VNRAVDLVADAHSRAPLSVVLNPFARELLAVLPDRIDDREVAGRLRVLSTLAGVS